MAGKVDLYTVRRPFPAYGALPADRGRVLELANARNDEKLVRLGFLELFTKRTALRDLPMCGQCGLYFSDEGLLTAHGDMRHRTPEEPIRANFAMQGMEALATSRDTTITGRIGVDVTGDAEERRLDREVPLYMDKTAASLRG
jgi:hypothetical protein